MRVAGWGGGGNPPPLHKVVIWPLPPVLCALTAMASGPGGGLEEGEVRLWRHSDSIGDYGEGALPQSGPFTRKMDVSLFLSGRGNPPPCARCASDSGACLSFWQGGRRAGIADRKWERAAGFTRRPAKGRHLDPVSCYSPAVLQFLLSTHHSMPVQASRSAGKLSVILPPRMVPFVDIW